MAGMIANDVSQNIFTDTKKKHSKTYDLHSALIDEFEKNIAKKDDDVIESKFSGLHFSDQAILLESLSKQSLTVLIAALGKLLHPKSLTCIDHHTKKRLISTMGAKKIGTKLNELETDDIIDFCNSVKRVDQIEIMKYLSIENRKIVRTAKNYHINSIGFVMDRNFYLINNSLTLQEALDSIRQQSNAYVKNKRIYEAFVVNSDKILVGTVSLESLVNSPSDVKVEEIMNDDFISLRSSDSYEDAVKIFNKYEINITPVLGPEGRLIGRL